MTGLDQIGADELVMALRCLEQALAHLDQAGAALCAAKTSDAIETVRGEIAARAPVRTSLQQS